MEAVAHLRTMAQGSRDDTHAMFLERVQEILTEDQFAQFAAASNAYEIGRNLASRRFGHTSAVSFVVSRFDARFLLDERIKGVREPVGEIKAFRAAFAEATALLKDAMPTILHALDRYEANWVDADARMRADESMDEVSRLGYEISSPGTLQKLESHLSRDARGIGESLILQEQVAAALANAPELAELWVRASNRTIHQFRVQSLAEH